MSGEPVWSMSALLSITDVPPQIDHVLSSSTKQLYFTL